MIKYYSEVKNEEVKKTRVNPSSMAAAFIRKEGLEKSSMMDYNRIETHIAQLVGQRNVLAQNSMKVLDKDRELILQQIDYINDDIRELLIL